MQLMNRMVDGEGRETSFAFCADATIVLLFCIAEWCMKSPLVIILHISKLNHCNCRQNNYSSHRFFPIRIRFTEPDLKGEVAVSFPHIDLEKIC